MISKRDLLSILSASKSKLDSQDKLDLITLMCVEKSDTSIPVKEFCEVWNENEDQVEFIVEKLCKKRVLALTPDRKKMRIYLDELVKDYVFGKTSLKERVCREVINKEEMKRDYVKEKFEIGEKDLSSKDLLIYFQDIYKEIYNQEYKVVKGKDIKLLKTMKDVMESGRKVKDFIDEILTRREKSMSVGLLWTIFKQYH